jgi:hypothetical protein
MKASDLRVGNWVSKHGEYYQITSATIVSLERGESDAEPIPLTEEWLLKFGFEFINYDTDIDEENGDFIYKEYRKKLYGVGYTYDIVSSPYAVYQFQIDFKWCEKGVAADLKYVHQLQNLYWCLRGEELTHGK